MDASFVDSILNSTFWFFLGDVHEQDLAEGGRVEHQEPATGGGGLQEQPAPEQGGVEHQQQPPAEGGLLFDHVFRLPTFRPAKGTWIS